ncbi:glycosyltransferase [Thermodesulfobacteriota bacterium]
MSFAKNVRLVSHIKFTTTSYSLPEVEYLTPKGFIQLFAIVPFIRDFFFALTVLLKADKRTTIICVSSSDFMAFVGIFNRLLPIRRRNILLCAPHIETPSRLKRKFLRWMIDGGSVDTVWSHEAVERQATYLRLPQEKFIFIPYKANHSIHPRINLPIGNYIFSGGNSQRDYQTLMVAVRDTEIPIIVSITKSEERNRLKCPENVIIVAAWEPAFSRLMAGSRFVVLCMDDKIIRGAGEASILNAMWHGKPVVCADNLAAKEYIKEGVTGYVVPAGDANALQDRIQKLWNTSPIQIEEMGNRAHEYVRAHFTHRHFIERVKKLACVLAADEKTVAKLITPNL